jgi:hypothetical protein
MEDRLVPAGFIVNTLLDTPDANPGDGLAQDVQGRTSLRAAIMEGNALRNSDVDMSIDLTDVRGTIQLGSELPLLLNNFWITGPGWNNLTIQRSNAPGTAAFRIFTIPDGWSSKIWDVTISNGDAGDGIGGAIVVTTNGTLDIEGVVLTGNSAGLGGAISNGGSLTISNTEMSWNNATTGEGALYNSGTATIQDGSQIVGNHAGQNGGGIYNGLGGVLGLASSSITFNFSVDDGGGIFNGGRLSMASGSLDGNQSTASDGGGLYNAGGGFAYLNGVTVESNTANNGGGVFVSNGVTTLDSCTIQGNTVRPGGVGTGGSWLLDAQPTTPNCIIGADQTFVQFS